MNQELKNLFEEFLKLLKKTRNFESKNTERLNSDIAIEAYSSIISKVESFIKVDDASFKEEFSLLSRYISEYIILDNEEVVGTWNRIKRTVRLNQNL